MQLLEELPLRHWQNYDDDDVASDIKLVHSALKRDFRFFSSFERYKRELEKGNLVKGPLHTVDFWKENWARFDTDSFGLIRKLVQIIQTTPAFPLTVRSPRSALRVTVAAAPPPRPTPVGPPAARRGTPLTTHRASSSPPPRASPSARADGGGLRKAHRGVLRRRRVCASLPDG